MDHDTVSQEMSQLDTINNTPLKNKESELPLMASSSSHEMITPSENDGKALDRIRSSEHASASPRCLDDAVVEELTLKNSIVGPSISNNVQNRQNRWQHLYQISGGSEPGPLDNNQWARSTTWENTDYTFLPGLLDQNKKISNENEIITNPNDTLDANNPSGGIRTKILSKSGFSKYFLKSSLKGKGVICKGPVFKQPQISSKPLLVEETIQTPLHNNISELSPNFASNEGVNLREWLKNGRNKVDKFESLRIFKRIVKLVHLSHNQGAILQDLHPSCLRLLHSNEVIYIGLNNTIQDSNKRKLSENNAFSSRNSMKKPKYNEGMRRWTQFSPSSDYNEGHFGKPEYKSSHVPDILSEEKWYISPEQFSERICTFSSNVYCLGVLLFELLSSFEHGKVHDSAMLDLQKRILPPNFLCEYPKEAGFCLWLLHPEPSLRPNTRDILQFEILTGLEEISGEKLLSAINEEEAESELLMHFLSSLKEKKEKDASKLISEMESIDSDIKEVEKRQPGPTKVFVKSTESQLIANIKQLESAYFSTRSNVQLSKVISRNDLELLKSRDQEEKIENPSDFLGSFFDGLCKYARYTKFKVRGILRNSESNNSANVICSLSFDRDEDFLATGGVSKKIKIFDFGNLFDNSVDIHYPIVEMINKSKLSCIIWNSYIRNYLASTDYDGLVKLWDVSTGQTVNQFAEHNERAWSVDFSKIDPTRLVSGSDDRLVKLWSLNERNSLCTIKNNANVCSVQFSSESGHLLSFSSADYKTYCYDLRNISIPWCTLIGHQKAVSYAKFLDSKTIVSASTDNTLKIWDLNKTNSTGLSNNACISTLRGHTNEKNFVGLSVADGYIACGSETNEVYTYYKSLPMPIASHKFGSIDLITGKESEEENGQFVSSVCWRKKSEMVVSANSSGCIKLLEMV